MDKNSLGIPKQFEAAFQEAYAELFELESLDDIPNHPEIHEYLIDCNSRKGKALIATLPLCKRISQSTELIMEVINEDGNSTDPHIMAKYFDEYFNRQGDFTDKQIAILDPDFPFNGAQVGQDDFAIGGYCEDPIYPYRWIFGKGGSNVDPATGYLNFCEIDEKNEYIYFRIKADIALTFPFALTTDQPVKIDLPKDYQSQSTDLTFEIYFNFNCLKLVKTVEELKKDSYYKEAIDSVFRDKTEIINGLNNFENFYNKIK